MHNIFTITVFAKTVIKAKNIVHITPSITQKTQQLNTQPQGLKLVKLSCLVGSVDKKRHIFPHDLLVANILIIAAHEFLYLTTIL